MCYLSPGSIRYNSISFRVCLIRTKRMLLQKAFVSRLRFGLSLVALSLSGPYLAVATSAKQILIWNIAKEFEKKRYTTESIVAEDFVVDIGSSPVHLLLYIQNWLHQLRAK